MCPAGDENLKRGEVAVAKEKVTEGLLRLGQKTGSGEGGD